MKKRTGIIVLSIILVAVILAIYFLLRPAGSKQPEGADIPKQSEQTTPEKTNPDNSSGESGEKQPVVIYIPDEQGETLVPVGTESEDNSDAALIKTLVGMNALPEGTEVKSSKTEDGVLKLDMNKAYGDAVRSAGTVGESMLIYTLVDTFAQARGAEKVLITIEGAILETGHNVYDTPLEMSTN